LVLTTGMELVLWILGGIKDHVMVDMVEWEDLNRTFHLDQIR